MEKTEDRRQENRREEDKSIKESLLTIDWKTVLMLIVGALSYLALQSHELDKRITKIEEKIDLQYSYIIKTLGELKGKTDANKELNGGNKIIIHRGENKK